MSMLYCSNVSVTKTCAVICCYHRDSLQQPSGRRNITGLKISIRLFLV